ncbi:hypothetical protein FB645_005011 [Coemansia sp. IMI 203386]|nr:hypothetical protein FB645_005011 [Coemansia sp. IMI 203386]
MIRHPPSSIAVTHKDVDYLATVQRKVLGAIQEGVMGSGNTQTQQAHQQQYPGGATNTQTGLSGFQAIDRHSEERAKRQQMSVSERLGL